MTLSDMDPDAKPADLLLQYRHLFTMEGTPGPVLDLACGDGRNGILLASLSLPVVLADRSAGNLERAHRRARDAGVEVETWEVDLEKEGGNRLKRRAFGAILVFRYLHRPLLPAIRLALAPGGVLMYETFTVHQVRFGRPHNPAFLLRPGELLDWFGHWERIHYFEGVKGDPPRAIAQLVARKPAVKAGGRNT